MQSKNHSDGGDTCEQRGAHTAAGTSPTYEWMFRVAMTSQVFSHRVPSVRIHLQARTHTHTPMHKSCAVGSRAGTAHCDTALSANQPARGLARTFCREGGDGGLR